MSRDPSPSDSRPRAFSSWLVAVLIGLLTVATTSAGEPDASPGAPPRASADDASQSRARARRQAADLATAAQSVAAAPAAPPASATTAAEPAAEDQGSEIICRNRQVVGTKIKRRVCATADQWNASRRASTNNAQEGLRQILERSTIVPSSATAPSPGN